MIRLFQFKNNFIGAESKQVEATYSALGYFDGLDLGDVKENGDLEREELLSDPFRFLIRDKKALLEECDYFNVAGIAEDEGDFWETEELPFIFISFIRMNKRSQNIKRIIEGIEENIRVEGEKKGKCYRTYDNSDLIICLRTKKYSLGYHYIENYRNLIQGMDQGNYLQKSFSICVLKQNILDDILNKAELIEDEEISCNLRCLIRDLGKAHDFCEDLKRQGFNVQNYGVLGSEDWVINIKNIRMVSLLDMYKTDGRFTHKKYKDAFMNIMTEILVKGKEYKNGSQNISEDDE